MAEATPWEIVRVVLIGPCKVKTPSGVKTKRCFTAIDPDTSWPEICEITDKRSQTVIYAFHNNWLCRYPRLIEVTFDNGSKFKSVFKEMCDSLGIKCRPTTSYNPQGNSIIERIYQVMGNILRAFEPEERELDPDDPGTNSCKLVHLALGEHYIQLYKLPRSISIWKRYDS
jgi:hypothetical protein